MEDPFLYGLLMFFSLIIWRIIDLIRFFRRNGPLKRGFRIGFSTLSPATRQYLTNLSEDVVVTNAFGGKVAWIFVDGRERLIWTDNGGSKGVDFAGYVDLRRGMPVLEYRIHLSTMLLVLCFSFLIIFLPLIALSFYTRQKAIKEFLEDLTREYFKNANESQYSLV